MDEPKVTPKFADMLEKTIGVTMKIAQETTVQKFNDMLTQFLSALGKAYAKVPDISTRIQMHSQILAQLVAKENTFVLTQFTRSCEPFFKDLETVDRDTFIRDVLPNVGPFRGFRISDYWEETPEKTRKTIWKYINHLWAFCVQYKECSDEEGITHNAMKMIQSEQFEELMRKTLSSLSNMSPELLASLNPEFSHQLKLSPQKNARQTSH